MSGVRFGIRGWLPSCPLLRLQPLVSDTGSTSGMKCAPACTQATLRDKPLTGPQEAGSMLSSTGEQNQAPRAGRGQSPAAPGTCRPASRADLRVVMVRDCADTNPSKLQEDSSTSTTCEQQLGPLKSKCWFLNGASQHFAAGPAVLQ